VEFDGYEGEWYLVDADDNYLAKAGTGAVFDVKAPKLEISIRDPNQNDGADVSGTSVPQGTHLQFQIDTNMYTAITNPLLRSPVYGVGGTGVNTDGYLDILIKTGSGTVLQTLYTNPDGQFSDLTGLNVDTQPYTWGRERNGKGPGSDWTWDTSAVNPITKEIAYPAGTYMVSVQSGLNNMKQNYLSGTAAYTGRTVSTVKTITLVPKMNEAIHETPLSLPPSDNGDSIATVMVNEPHTTGCNNFLNGVPMVGVLGELVKWNGISWDSSPVIGSGITDSTGTVRVTFTEKYPGTFEYKFHIGGQAWSNLITVMVLAYPVAVFDATPTSGSTPLHVTFTDTSTGDKISSRIWQYKLNSDSTWTTFIPDRTSSFIFTKTGSYDVKLTVIGTGGSDDEVKTNYIHLITTGTSIPQPLSVTAVSTQKIQSTLPPSNSGATNLTTAASAEMMFRANPEHTGVYDNGGIVTTNTELWRFATGGSIYSSPAVSNGVVYVGSLDNNTYAIDAVTGKEKWRFATGGSVSSSPVASNGVVYVGSADKNLYAIDAVIGKEKWRLAFTDDVSSSPAVSNGVVYIGNYYRMSAIDAVTGKGKWWSGGEFGTYSSPAVSNGVVYFGKGWDKNLYAIDAVTGKEKWRFAIALESGGESSPAVSNGVVYVGSADKNLYAIDAVTGKEKWRFSTGGSVYSSPSVSNGVVYVGSLDNNTYAIDAVTGKEKWRFATGYYVSSSPAISNGVVYVGGVDGNLYAIGEAPATPITTPTAITAPVIESTPSSPSPSNSVYSNLSLLIIVILAVFLIAGGGYMIYRMKKKPSGYQPPKRKEKKSTAPHPPPTVSTTKPELTLTLDRNRLIADDWDRMTIQLANRGDGHARDVRLIFSEEFDTKWIKPAMINAGATTLLDIGIRPKVKGKIPLEVTAMYHDVYSKEFRETHEFWIDVVEKDNTISPPSETPSSPVSQFTPRPLTPKQLPPDLSDRYTESEFIGKGGFARVFKAKRKDGKYVAVKIPISLDAMTGKSFIAEMQNWTKLSHPNIVRLYDFNIMPMPFFEEELCDIALADQNKPIESEEAAWILFNICEGLKFAHTHKIIHRDLKPQNILLQNGVPKISDWGLSKIISESTTTTITSFTPFYAAPEQINGRAKDERTDIWQLGVILYELVTGILPFTGDSMVEIGMNIATKDPTRPGEIKPDAKVIDDVVMKCLQKNPAKRYQSVLELQKDLALYLRENYTELLKTSITANDYTRSAYYCGDLVMINMLTGDIPTAYKYLLDLVHYSKGDVKAEAWELSEQLKMRMEMGVVEIPEELIQKAEIIVHQVSVGFRNRG